MFVRQDIENDEAETKMMPDVEKIDLKIPLVNQRYIEYVKYNDKMFMILKLQTKQDVIPMLYIYPFDIGKGIIGQAILQ